jgi:glutamyl-tRNA synthetase/glutamyl-Q tRNA(Asp) synthetase
VWGVARVFRGRVLLRIEDHDQTRARPEFERSILEDLAWLGFVADQPVIRQSDRLERYREALKSLEERGLVYACRCSRKAILETAGPEGTGETRYSGACRQSAVDGTREKARRVRLDPVRVEVHDLRLGTLEQNPADETGDLLARDRNGHWTYQFAVTVDDLDQGIDLVIRGEDLLTSTGRQIQLASLLGRKSPASFLHHPLITRPDGQKLSKSNRDTGIRDLRALGWSVERVLGQAAAGLGLSSGEPMDGAEIEARLRELFPAPSGRLSEPLS